MLWAFEHVLHWPLFDDAALLHDRDAVGDVGDDAEIMGDEQHRHAAPLLNVSDQPKDLRLRRDVECRGWFVRDQDRRLERECHCDHGALTLATRQLMRIAADDPLRIAHADLFEEGAQAGVPLSWRELVVRLERFHDLVADPDHRIERRHRLLKDHRDTSPAQRPPFCCREVQQIASLKVNGPRNRANGLGQQAHHGSGADRFAGAGFTDDAEDLPPIQRK